MAVSGVELADKVYFSIQSIPELENLDTEDQQKLKDFSYLIANMEEDSVYLLRMLSGIRGRDALHDENEISSFLSHCSREEKQFLFA